LRHLRLRDFDPRRISPIINNFGMDSLNPFRVVIPAIGLTIAFRLVRG
jgi:hypothetical protein